MNIKNETLRKAYDGSYYTITGAGGDINEWKNGYAGLLRDKQIGEIKEWIEFTGRDMNEEFGQLYRSPHDRFQDNIHFLAFSLDGLDTGKLAIFKLEMQDRWFDDIVNNSIRNADD